MISRDTTERRRADAALRAAEARLTAILDHSPAVIFVKDREGRYVLVNRGFEAMARAIGVAGPYLGRTDAEMVPADVAARFRADDLAVMATREVKVYEETMVLAGARRTGLSTKFPLIDEAGEVSAVCVINLDITPRVRAEEALRRGEERLRLALAAGRMGVWDWDLRTGAIDWSDNLEAIHGIAPGSFVGTLAGFQALVHPDDRAIVDAAIGRAIAERSSYEVEFRNLRPDGAIRWMAAKGTVFAEGDVAVRMIGVALDVSERVRGERAARFLADASAVSPGSL